MTTHVCEIDETAQGPPEPQSEVGTSARPIREAILLSYEMWRFRDHIIQGRLLENLRWNMRYQHIHPSRKRRMKVDVDALVKTWTDVIAKFCSAHDKDDLDLAETEIEKLLQPILTAPVRDLRSFYQKLVDTLKADSRIPFFAWRAFETWHELDIKKAPDEDIKQLRRDLAEEIANMVEDEVKGDLREAMINALMWRNPQKLEQMKETIQEGKESGRKPRMKGRESCLFLQIEDAKGDVQEVML